MATLVYVVGRSGSGKSTSICPIDQVGIKGLDPKSTVIVNTDQKPLPAPGFTEMYGEKKGNYYKTNDTLAVIENILKPAPQLFEQHILHKFHQKFVHFELVISRILRLLFIF